MEYAAILRHMKVKYMHVCPDGAKGVEQMFRKQCVPIWFQNDNGRNKE